MREVNTYCDRCKIKIESPNPILVKIALPTGYQATKDLCIQCNSQLEIFFENRNG